MPTKSLVEICQAAIGKHLDALYDLGDTPFQLLKEPLKRATAQQLYRIEKCNPHILEDTNGTFSHFYNMLHFCLYLLLKASSNFDLWITHCLTFRDIRLSYESGHIPPENNWREIYLERHEENQRKRQLIGAKIKSHYNQLQHEKEARSTKFLNKAIAPTKRRSEHNSSSNAKRARGSSLFAKTMLAAKQEAAIYHSHDSRSTDNRRHHSNQFFTPASHSVPTTTVISIEKRPSALQKAYSSQPLKEPMQIKPPPLVMPPPVLYTPFKPTLHSSIPTKHAQHHHRSKDPPLLETKAKSFNSWSAGSIKLDDDTKQKQAKTAKDSAIVNFDIFKELSGH